MGQRHGSPDMLLFVDLAVHLSAHLVGLLEDGKGETSHLGDVDCEGFLGDAWDQLVCKLYLLIFFKKD